MARFCELLAPDGGNYVGYAHLGDGCYVWLWNGADADVFDRYVNEWKEKGFDFLGEYSLGDNRYILLEGKENTVYLSFVPSVSSIRTYSEPKGASIFPESVMPAVAPLEGYTPTFWQLPVDCKGSAANGGMSYVFQLADGSFFIIDGGYPTELEADNLYAFLKEKSDAVGIDAPVISGWFISHLHGDHYGCFMKFAEKYSDRSELKAFYYNFPANNETFPFEHGKRFEEKLQPLIDKWDGVRIYRKLHTGMRFYVCDLQADVLYTHEELFPKRAVSQNDTSTVLRVTFGGQRILFPMDIMQTASRIIEAEIPAEELKADIVEFSHHGYEGATKEFYDLAAAPTVLWPMNIYGWQRPDKSNVFERWKAYEKTRLQPMPNAYICNEAPYVKKIIVAGAGLAELKLPYTPEGDKLPDYVAIHDAIAAVEEPDGAEVK